MEWSLADVATTGHGLVIVQGGQYWTWWSLAEVATAGHGVVTG